MAHAPRPGSRAEAENARVFLRIRIKDKTLDLMPSLTIAESFVVRSSTGNQPFESFLSAFGMDSMFVLWWVARRQNGEPALSFKQAVEEWPTDLTEDDIDLTEIDLDGEPEADDSPEGPGPGS